MIQNFAQNLSPNLGLIDPSPFTYFSHTHTNTHTHTHTHTEKKKLQVNGPKSSKTQSS